MSFNDDLETHLQSICDRDIDLLESTLSKDESLSLILPTGALRDTREAYIEFHESWFEDKDWTITHEIVSTKESSESATGIVKTEFMDVDEDGKEYQVNLMISLNFAKEDGQWRLTHCQNTVVK